MEGIWPCEKDGSQAVNRNSKTVVRMVHLGLDVKYVGITQSYHGPQTIHTSLLEIYLSHPAVKQNMKTVQFFLMGDRYITVLGPPARKKGSRQQDQQDDDSDEYVLHLPKHILFSAMGTTGPSPAWYCGEAFSPWHGPTTGISTSSSCGGMVLQQGLPPCRCLLMTGRSEQDFHHNAFPDRFVRFLCACLESGH